MTYPMRAIKASEFDAFRQAVERGFGNHARPEDGEFTRENFFEFDRSLAAFDGTQIVGTAIALSFRITVPGAGPQPTGAVTMVTVQPTHRRRGILTEMMRMQLQDIRERGEATASLWASESIIYRRFGYGMATLSERWSIERTRAGFAPPITDTGRMRVASPDEFKEAVPAIHDRAVARRPGMMPRTESMWAVRLRDPEHWRGGASALFFALHSTGPVDDGYVMYRIRREWRDGIPNSTIVIVELAGANPDVDAVLFNYCCNIDLTTTVESWNRPVDDAIWWRLADPRRLARSPRDGLWLRIVDTPKALSARRYSAEGRIVVAVQDEFVGLAGGRFEVEGGPDGATCRKTTRKADITLGPTELASLYLGAVSARSLADAGRIVENSAGAIDRTDLMFDWRPAAWCSQDF